MAQTQGTGHKARHYRPMAGGGTKRHYLRRNGAHGHKVHQRVVSVARYQNHPQDTTCDVKGQWSLLKKVACAKVLVRAGVTRDTNNRYCHLSGLPGTDPCGDRTDDSSVVEKTTRSYTKALQNNCWFYDRHEKLLVLI